MKLATNASPGAGDELVRRADLEEPTLGDHADAVGERGRVFEVVRDQDASAAPSSRSNSCSSARTPARVCASSAAMRLVEQEHGRVARQRPRERDPLALAAGELRRPRLGEMADPEPLHQLGRAAAAAEADVRLHRQVREERVLLEDEPDAAPVGSAQRPAGRVEPGGAAERNAARVCGRSSPATTRSTVVLPAPDGPTSANVSPGSTVRSSAAREGAKRVVEGDVERHRKADLGGEEDHRADRDQQGADREREVEVEVERLVDRQRERLGDAAQAAGEHERRAELADPAGEGEGSARRRARLRRAAARRARTSRAGPAPRVRAAWVSAGRLLSKAAMAERM